MRILQKSAWKETPMLMLISLGLLVLPVSNSMGQIPLYLVSVIWLVQLARGKTTLNKSTCLMLGGWMLLILISLTYAVHPELGIRKLSRFLYFPLACAVTAVCLKQQDRGQGMEVVMKYLVLGVTALGIYDLFRFPIKVHQGVVFEDVGNMTSPQFYLVGLVLWLGLMSLDRKRVGRIWWACLPLLLCGLMLHQKRGVWLASAITIGLWTLWNRRWKTLLLLVLFTGLSLTLPFVQVRLHRIPEVLKATHGGRMTLWTEVAPRLFAEYPWGMGYNGSKFEDFREVLPAKFHLEEGLRHLHDNVLQIRLELGWPGLIWWLTWIGLIFWKAFRRGPPALKEIRGALAFAFLGLILNGMVEYNFGDSEVLKVYLVLMGLIDVGQLQDAERERSTAAQADPKAKAFLEEV